MRSLITLPLLFVVAGAFALTLAAWLLLGGSLGAAIGLFPMLAGLVALAVLVAFMTRHARSL